MGLEDLFMLISCLLHILLGLFLLPHELPLLPIMELGLLLSLLL